MSELERAKKYLDMIPDELRGNPNDLVQLLAAMVAKVEELEHELALAEECIADLERELKQWMISYE